MLKSLTYRFEFAAFFGKLEELATLVLFPCGSTWWSSGRPLRKARCPVIGHVPSAACNPPPAPEPHTGAAAREQPRDSPVIER